MYQTLNADLTKSKDSFEKPNVQCTSEAREQFIDELISDYLSPQQLKNKDSLSYNLKFKKHELTQSKSTKKKKELNTNSSIKHKHSINIKELNKSNNKKTYEFFLKMNSLWNDYAKKCLQIDKLDALNEQIVLESLKQFDYHGALIEVIKSSNKSLIGTRGIVVHERKNTFVLITNQNTFKIIPKTNNLFQIEILNVKFVLIGSNMCTKPELRSTKATRPKEIRNIF
jgi:ribonuclease P protein subunit POP4